jgi:hypothetical protein
MHTKREDMDTIYAAGRFQGSLALGSLGSFVLVRLFESSVLVRLFKSFAISPFPFRPTRGRY